jgi:hypothetical protein
MIKLDDNLLQELGLAGLPPEEKKKLLAHIYETLEMRVGMKLAEQMSDAQLSEFEQFIDRNDEAGALRWLETNFPHYKDVVSAEFEKLKGEIRQVAPQILTAGQQIQQQPAAQTPPPAYPQQPPMQGQPQYPPYQQPMAPPPSQPYGYGQPNPPMYPPQQPPMPPQQQDPNQRRSDYDLAA